MSRSTGKEDGGSYELAQDALFDAFEAARNVSCAPGSPEMDRLDQAEAHREDLPNANAREDGDGPPTDTPPAQ